jgi:hypothetical protein
MNVGKRFVLVRTEYRSTYYHNSGKTSAVDPDKVTHIEDRNDGAVIHFMGGGSLHTVESVMALAQRLTNPVGSV